MKSYPVFECDLFCAAVDFEIDVFFLLLKDLVRSCWVSFPMSIRTPRDESQCFHCFQTCCWYEKFWIGFLKWYLFRYQVKMSFFKSNNRLKSTCRNIGKILVAHPFSVPNEIEHIFQQWDKLVFAWTGRVPKSLDIGMFENFSLFPWLISPKTTIPCSLGSNNCLLKYIFYCWISEFLWFAQSFQKLVF